MAVPKTYTIGTHCFTLTSQAESVLRSYHEKVKVHLGPFEDSLLGAFESRLVEALTDLQKKEPLLSKKSIEQLISKLGSPREVADSGTAQAKTGWYRVNAHKMLGGVAAGTGFRLGIDPVWIRLALVFIALAGTPYQITWLALVLYGILYVGLPNIEPNELTTQIPKRLYRDPQKRIIAGVASGISNYFNVSLFWTRALLLISLLFALTGLLVYITLWILTPKEKALSKPLEVKVVS